MKKILPVVLACTSFIVVIIIIQTGFFHKKQATTTISSFTPNKHININKVMNYPCEEEIKRHMKDHKVSYETAKFHERELKRWMLISQDADESLDMFSPEVDGFWHTWLLYTKNYAQFCNDCFGKFIHHCPKKIEDVVI